MDLDRLLKFMTDKGASDLHFSSFFFLLYKARNIWVLDRLWKFRTDRGASAFLLKPTGPPLLRINGRLLPIEAPPLKPEDLTEMLLGILSPRQKTKLEEK